MSRGFPYKPLETSHVWKPNATITDRGDVAVSLIFIRNPVLYSKPNYDPIFRAADRTSAGDETFYNTSTPVSILGCIEDMEFCNPAGPGDPVCATAMDLDNENTLHLSETQLATLSRFDVSISAIGEIATFSSPLASRSLVLGKQFSELPSTQWRQEVTRWFAMNLAAIQQTFVDSVTGPPDPVLEPYFVKIEGASASCERQVVRNIIGFQNFNMQAIVIVLGLGSVVITLGLSIDAVVGLFQRHFLRSSDGWVSWTLDGTFQLQRLAYRGAGIRAWRDEDTCIPTVDGRPFPPVNRETMAFAECDSEEGMILMQGLKPDRAAEGDEGERESVDRISQHSLP